MKLNVQVDFVMENEEFLPNRRLKRNCYYRIFSLKIAKGV